MLSSGDCVPGASAEDCITSARRLWRLSSLAALVVVRLDVVSLPPRSPRPEFEVAEWR